MKAKIKVSALLNKPSIHSIQETKAELLFCKDILNALKFK